MFSKGPLFSIGRLLGQPLKLDAATEHISRPSVARICVEINVLQPLSRRIWIGHGDSGFWQMVKYEHIPSYCSNCHRFGHLDGKCGQDSSAPTRVAPLPPPVVPKRVWQKREPSVGHLRQEDISVGHLNLVAQPVPETNGTIGSQLNLEDSCIPSVCKNTKENSSHILDAPNPFAAPDPSAKSMLSVLIPLDEGTTTASSILPSINRNTDLALGGQQKVVPDVQHFELPSVVEHNVHTDVDCPTLSPANLAAAIAVSEVAGPIIAHSDDAGPVIDPIFLADSTVVLDVAGISKEGAAGVPVPADTTNPEALLHTNPEVKDLADPMTPFTLASSSEFPLLQSSRSPVQTSMQDKSQRLNVLAASWFPTVRAETSINLSLDKRTLFAQSGRLLPPSFDNSDCQKELQTEDWITDDEPEEENEETQMENFLDSAAVRDDLYIEKHNNRARRDRDFVLLRRGRGRSLATRHSSRSNKGVPPKHYQT